MVPALRVEHGERLFSQGRWISLKVSSKALRHGALWLSGEVGAMWLDGLGSVKNRMVADPRAM